MINFESTLTFLMGFNRDYSIKCLLIIDAENRQAKSKVTKNGIIYVPSKALV